MYSKQLSVLHWMNNSLISKVYLVYNVLIFQKLLEEKNSHIIIIIIIIKTYIWHPLIRKWFFSLELKSKNEMLKVHNYYLHKKTIMKNVTT